MYKLTIRKTVILVFVAVLAWRMASLGLADYYSVNKPESALFWRSGHPEALFRMAEKSVAEKQWGQARKYALKAVKANKLDGRPYRVLAQIAEHEGSEKRAAELFNHAVSLAPRDLVSHAWLLEHALRQRKAQPAVAHLDALLRVAPELSSILLPQTVILAVNPQAQQAMLASMALNPPWRRHLLNALAASPQPVDAIAPFYIKLHALSALDPPDYTPLLERLNKDGRYQQAFLTWANFIPDKQQKYLGNIFDGGFELAFEDQIGVFGWQAQQIDGAEVQLSSTKGTYGENSFQAQFEGRRTPFAHLSQLLALPPGQWRLSFRAKTDRLDSPRGLVWRITCHGNGKTIGETAPIQGRFDWREFGHTFSVPEECVGQRLILMIPARIPAETLISGSLWLDDVEIQRVEQQM